MITNPNKRNAKDK